MRSHAAGVASSIARDAPGLTDHGIEHLDAVWATADVLVDETWQFNAVEAFVFGAAVLVHDLALTTSAYPGGRADVEATTAYRDAFARAKARRDGDTTVNLEAAKREALKAALRAQHARRAADLPTMQFSGPHGPLFLIEDSALRHSLGWVIGQVAASHGDDLDVVDTKLRGIRPTPKDMGGLAVDALVLACLLRCADAVQLDGRRAREFRQLVQAPTGSSLEHWTFQASLHPARREADRLVFESIKPFAVDAADAWWLAYDWLVMADGEIRDVDALLADRRAERRFAARSVAAVDSPERLAERVRTQGWLPVDARIHTTDAVNLARTLGGRQLYGDEPLVPLRELIQNGLDAICALAALRDTSPDGAVEISLAAGARGLDFRVMDHGIGMTSRSLTGALLNFGTSSWHTDSIADFHPGLAGAGFRSIGRFGIGFFATFIWSERITVISRASHARPDETVVLEFTALAHRPLVRDARADEQLLSSGTAVIIETTAGDLTDLEPTLPFSVRESLKDGLDALVAWVAPASPVEIRIRGSEGQPVVARDDWLKLSPVDLVERVSCARLPPEHHDRLERTLRPILMAGRVVGRAALWSELGPARATLTVGGLRSASLRGLAGVLVGDEPTVARNSARPIADTRAMGSWLTEQLSLLGDLSMSVDEQMRYAAAALGLGLETGTLALCTCNDGPLDEVRLRQWARAQTGWVLLVEPSELFDVAEYLHDDIHPERDALMVRADHRPDWLELFVENSSGPWLAAYCRSVLEEEWGGSISMWDDIDDHDYWAEIDVRLVGHAHGEEVHTSQYDAIRRPVASAPERPQPLVRESVRFRREGRTKRR